MGIRGTGIELEMRVEPLRVVVLGVNITAGMWAISAACSVGRSASCNRIAPTPYSRNQYKPTQSPAPTTYIIQVSEAT